MTHLPFTLLAYFLNALAVLANKSLLNKTIPDPLVYVFYISLASFLAILGLPFAHIPSLETFTLGSLSTILWTIGAYFMFKALKIGNVSRVIPVIGTLIPVILLVSASETKAITSVELPAVWFLTAGMVLLTLSDWKGNLKISEMFFEILSAGFFAFSYIILRQAYLKADFFSVLIWSRLILFPLGATLLFIPKLRRKIITSRGLKLNFLSKAGLIFLGGQLFGAVSELLLLFSISLANPALVNSLQGTQYIYLLFFDRKKYSFLTLLPKILGIGLIGLGLYFLTTS